MGSHRISNRVRSMPPSGIREFFDIAEQMADVISLSVGEPNFKTPAPIREAARRSMDISTAYTSNSGLLELRMALAAHLEKLYGVRYDPHKEILITVGVSEGLQSATLGLLDPGDEVIIPDPGYIAYQGCVMLTNATAVYVPTYASTGFEVTAEAIEAAITPRTRAIMLGYPNNPTGAVMSRERLVEIVDVAQRHDLVLLSDEIYDRLVYDTEHTCVASLPGAQERTVLMGGFSKAYAMTGWRLAWIAAPEDITAAASKVHQYSILSAPTMSQYAALEALRVGEPFVQEMVAEYNRRRLFMVGCLNQLGLPTLYPKGAFYAFPYIGHLGVSSTEFAQRLLREGGVALIPGSAFGACGEGYLRVAYAGSMENIETAMTRLEAFMRKAGWLDKVSVTTGVTTNVWHTEPYTAQSIDRVG